MRHTTVLVTTFVIALLWSASAQAQRATPGLWENTMTMKSNNGQLDAAMAQMRERMATMTPEQRAQMEAMMASRGVGLGGGPGQPTTIKVCITPEQAANDDFARQDGNCKMTSKERSGKSVRVKFVCEGEQKSMGEGEFTFDSDKAHRGRMVVNTTVKGLPERMEMTTTGRWLSADCGAVKPLATK